MDLTVRLTILERMFAIYDECIGAFDLACEKYCAHCCTTNVTLTTLEGYRIFAHLERSGDRDCLEVLLRSPQPERFVPRVTINRLADICARGGDPPEESWNPDAGPCPVLSDAACPLYPVRPFACRCMVSARDCGQTGFADMDPFILTVNDIFLQHIEHIDAKGYTGSFADIMQYVADDAHRRDYVAGRSEAAPEGLLANQPIFVLMIPPEHRKRAQPLLQQIRSIQV